MSAPSLSPADPLIAAADWFSRQRAGTLTAAETEAFQGWCAASDANTQAYREIERNWRMLGEVAQEPAILETRERDCAAYDHAGWRRRGVAACAGLLIAASAGWAAFEAELPARLGLMSPPSLQRFSNDIGQRSNVLLADGSTVTLDTNSEVRVLAMGATRTLELVRGRAFFAVAKDPTRPFFVRAAGRIVRATGTEFAVSLARRDVTVTLVEGSVNVDQPAGLFSASRRVRMHAGTKLDTASDGWNLRRFDTRQEMSWLSGQLTFVHMPLAQAVAEVNRYSSRTLEFEGGTVPDRKIVGVFHAGDVEGLAQAIQLDGFAHITTSDDRKIVMSE